MAKTTIHGVKWIPDSGEFKAILQITHGMVEYIERYREFAGYLNEQGYLVVGHDHLGHGASVTSQAEWGYINDNPSDTLVADMHQLRTKIQGENPGVPYFMMGHSMGSYMLQQILEPASGRSCRCDHHGNRKRSGWNDEVWNDIVPSDGDIPGLALQKQAHAEALLQQAI